MISYYYFKDDRVVSLDFEEQMRKTLFNHPQRLGALAHMIYDKKVVFDEKTSLPIISLYADEYTNKSRFFESDSLIDYFSLGLFMFVSEKLKDIFDSFKVDAFYSPATIKLDENNHSDYYLFCPKIAIDAIDLEHSIYSVKDEKNPRSLEIKKLLLNNSKVNPEINLCMLANIHKPIKVLNECLAQSLIINNITGLTVKRIEEGSWMG